MLRSLLWLRSLSVIVFIATQSLAAAASEDTSSPLASWDALAPTVEPFDDPFLAMTLEQKRDLRDVLLSREAETAGSGSLELRGAASAARIRLEAAGLDPDYLLVQRLVVMERRREEATGVTSTFLDQRVLLDGFVLPLVWDGDRVVEFLLVPWVGACIHTPPPPPNQIVHVAFPEGLKLERRFEAVRLEGTMRHRPAEHALFLIDGSRQIPASYGLDGAALAGQPDEIVAASASDVPALIRAQIWVNTLFTSGMSEIGKDGSAQAILLAVLLAFGYGALHTLGPGHGKAVVISYFVGTGGSLRRGLAMGARIAIFHVASAIMVVFLLDLAVRQTTGAAPSDYRMIRLLSYSLIVAIGAVMLWQAIRSMRQQTPEAVQHKHDHHHADHAHGACAGCNAHEARGGGGWIAAAVGVVPCTGALIVMLFGLANDLIWPAILMVVAISAGMAVAMSALGVAALWGRGWAERRFASDQPTRERFAKGARLAGAICVLVIGGGLFFNTLLHAPTDRLQLDGIATVSESLNVSGG
ncbi:DUF3299 domain-containing protein [Ruegeria sp. HKCCSP351]|uniref:HoxN/HupN/NixA family nickel/cobalt transporter n=1 Tax=Ruegeria sp. HKCCSP351 TaxID=2794832 RepID=UPI001AE620B0|nr:DUF3299 domain-containing protein [Ruegeria sp. HKCCSP351]